MLRANSSVKIFNVGTDAVGKYDAYCLLMTRKLNELTELVRRIDIKPFVRSLDVLIFAHLWDSLWHPENIVVKPSEHRDAISIVHRSREKIEPALLNNDVDKFIAKALMENSRTAFEDIAAKLKISTATVTRRYRFLREKNILNLSSITIDLFKLGYKVIVDGYIRVENRGALREVKTQLLQVPNATFCAEFAAGTYDIRVAMPVSDFQDIFSLKKRVYAIKNIKSAEFYLHEIPIPWLNDFIGKNLI